MTTISRIHAREVLDSRGSPTVEVEVHCANGASGRAIVPSGASTGKHEAVELRDGDPSRFGGKGVRKAVANVRETIAPQVVGLDPTQQDRIDRLMIDLDGTPNKSRLGANAILGVSLAVAHTAAAAEGVPLWKYLARGRTPKLPLPMVNMISGGLHAGGNLDFQDFLLLPIGARTYSEALEMTTRVYRSVSRLLEDRKYEGVLVGDEGGFGPRLTSNEEALSILTAAIARAGYPPGQQTAIAIDVAASHFYHNGENTDYGDRPEFYQLKTSGESKLSSAEMTELLSGYVGKFPVQSIEDGLDESDWEGWEFFTRKQGSRIQIIGDDLFVTNPDRLRLGIERKVANSILIKPNQIGTLTETLQVIDMARAAGYRPVISARSGETEDSTIADLAVATGAGQIKIGSVARSERLAKYNQLLRIEEELPGPENFAGWQPVR
jgi:enolase